MSTEPDVRGEHSASDSGSSDPETTHQEIPQRRRRLSGELGRIRDAARANGHSPPPPDEQTDRPD